MQFTHQGQSNYLPHTAGADATLRGRDGRARRVLSSIRCCYIPHTSGAGDPPSVLESGSSVSRRRQRPSPCCCHVPRKLGGAAVRLPKERNLRKKPLINGIYRPLTLMGNAGSRIGVVSKVPRPSRGVATASVVTLVPTFSSRRWTTPRMKGRKR